MNESISSESDTAEVLADKIETIPSLPAISEKVLGLLREDDVSFEEVDRVIRTDPSMVGKVLQVANKRYYGHEGKVTNLKKAIQLIGFNTLRSVVVAQGMENEYSAPEVPEFPREAFWEYSMATGVAGEIIGEYLGLDSERKGELFSAAHLHAVGRIILDQYLHREFVKVVKAVSEQGARMYDTEREILGTTHCEIGSAVLENWNLPDTIVAAAKYYYHPDQCDVEDAQFTVDVTHLSSVLTKTKGYGFSGDEDLSYLNEERVAEIGLSDDDIQTILTDIFPKQFEAYSN